MFQLQLGNILSLQQQTHFLKSRLPGAGFWPLEVAPRSFSSAWHSANHCFSLSICPQRPIYKFDSSVAVLQCCAILRTHGGLGNSNTYQDASTLISSMEFFSLTGDEGSYWPPWYVRLFVNTKNCFQLKNGRFLTGF